MVRPNALIFNFKASLSGFPACRPLIMMDGTHMHYKFGGTLLTAITLDAQGSIFPIAIALVDKENGDNWKWFLNSLKNAISHYFRDLPTFTFITDRQKGRIHQNRLIFSGLVQGLYSEFNTHHHAFCFRHLVENWKKSLALKSEAFDVIKAIFYKAAHASSVTKYHAAMKEMKDLDQQAYDWFQKEENSNKHWARAFFKGKNQHPSKIKVGDLELTQQMLLNLSTMFSRRLGNFQ